jgi:hypothetical protein
MDQRRAYLKELSARSARRWSAQPLPRCFAGETRIETRNTVYLLRDGVCYLVTRREEAGAGRAHPGEFAGMRVVGWLLRDDPRAEVCSDWRPGAYAVLWRPRAPDEAHSAVALTSSTVAFRVVARTAPPPLPSPTPSRAIPSPPRLRRESTPPPLPLALPRSSGIVPRDAARITRPPSPPSWVPPPPPSMTRLHMDAVPAAPETPTPAVPRKSSVPPPLPVHAVGIRPMPLRIPVHG